MVIKIDDKLDIHLIEQKHAQSLFNCVNENRDYLREWLPFVDRMKTIEFAQNFVKETVLRNKQETEYAFVITDQNQVIGRIGVYKIDNQNKIGEIGYWIIENQQGKGIVTKACKEIINFAFNILNLNRIEIKCGTENLKSKSIPEKLNFTKEGIIRKGELVHDTFIDLYLYSLLKTDQR